MNIVDSIQPGNESDDFDTSLNSLLRGYVYALRDPRDQKIFYIGKAGGKDASGNGRVLDHFEEARKALANGSRNHSAKIRRILEIWSVGEDVEWFIVRHGLDSAELAHHVEGALIDLLEISQNGPTLNVQGGHQTATHGLLTRVDLDSLKAQPVDPRHFIHRPIFVFPIQRAIASGRSVFDATSKSWRVGQRFQNLANSIAVGVSSGVARGVFAIDRWVADGSLSRFEGQDLHDPDKELIGRNFVGVINKAKGYWQRGNYLVVEFNGGGKVKFVRGSASSDWVDL